MAIKASHNATSDNNRIESALQGGAVVTRFVKGLSYLVGGTAFAQALGVLIAPVLTRIYDPTEFGALGVYVSTLGLISVFSALKYESAITLPSSHRTAANLLALSLLVNATVSALTALVCWGGLIYRRGDTGEHMHFVLLLLPVGVLAVGTYRTLSYWAIRRGYYDLLARTKASQALGSVGAQVGLGLLRVGALGLIVGNIIGQSSGIRTIGRRLLNTENVYVRSISWKRIWGVGYRYRRFPQIAAIGSVFNSAGLNVGPLMFATLYGAEVAGFFTLADRIISAPINLIGTSAAQVIQGEASRIRRDARQLRKMVTRIMLALGGVGAVLAGAVAIGGPWLFAFVFGEEWITAGTFARLMSGYAFAKFLGLPLSQLLIVLERQGTWTLWSIGRLLLVVAAVVIPHWLEWGASAAVASMSITMALLYGIVIVLALAAVGKGTGMRARSD